MKSFKVVTLILLLVSCQAQSPSSQSETSRDLDLYSQKAKEVLEPLKQNLMQTLMKELEHSAEQAVKACQLEAPKIADEAMGKDKRKQVEIEGQMYSVSLGRSSHKVRNPENRPEYWMEEYIEVFSGRSDFNPEQEIMVKELNSSRVAYLEPIAAGGLCMTCHGADIDADLADFIKKKYPEDKATGFDVGEFRGIFWVEFEKI